MFTQMEMYTFRDTARLQVPKSLLEHGLLSTAFGLVIKTDSDNYMLSCSWMFYYNVNMRVYKDFVIDDVRKIIQETAYVRNIDPAKLKNFLQDNPTLRSRLRNAHSYDYQYLLEDVRAYCQQVADAYI